MVIFVEHGTLSLAAPLCACASIAAAALLCVLLVLLVLLVLAVLTALNDYRTVCFVVLMRATRAAGCRLNHVLCSSRVAVRGRSNTWRCGAVRPRGLAVQSAVQSWVRSERQHGHGRILCVALHDVCGLARARPRHTVGDP